MNDVLNPFRKSDRRGYRAEKLYFRDGENQGFGTNNVKKALQLEPGAAEDTKNVRLLIVAMTALWDGAGNRLSFLEDGTRIKSLTTLSWLQDDSRLSKAYYVLLSTDVTFITDNIMDLSGCDKARNTYKYVGKKILTTRKATACASIQPQMQMGQSACLS